MSLPEWQISLISASIGALIGTVIPFIYIFAREKQKKRQIRDALCSELLLAHETLAESLANGKDADKMGFFISSQLSLYESFPLNTAFYDDVGIETLATSVSTEALKNLPSTYNLICRFNTNRRFVQYGFYIEKTTLSNLIEQINKTIHLIRGDNKKVT